MTDPIEVFTEPSLPAQQRQKSVASLSLRANLFIHHSFQESSELLRASCEHKFIVAVAAGKSLDLCKSEASVSEMFENGGRRRYFVGVTAQPIYDVPNKRHPPGRPMLCVPHQRTDSSHYKLHHHTPQD